MIQNSQAGAPGIENRMNLLFTYGVLENVFRSIVSCKSRRPILRGFRDESKKGTLAPGADADILLWDPTLENVISAKTPNTAVIIRRLKVSGLKARACMCSHAASGSCRIEIDRQTGRGRSSSARALTPSKMG